MENHGFFVCFLQKPNYLGGSGPVPKIRPKIQKKKRMTMPSVDPFDIKPVIGQVSSHHHHRRRRREHVLLSFSLFFICYIRLEVYVFIDFIPVSLIESPAVAREVSCLTPVLEGPLFEPRCFITVFLVVVETRRCIFSRARSALLCDELTRTR